MPITIELSLVDDPLDPIISDVSNYVAPAPASAFYTRQYIYDMADPECASQV